MMQGRLGDKVATVMHPAQGPAGPERMHSPERATEDAARGYFLGGSITDVLQNLGIKRVLIIALLVAAVVLVGHYIWQRRRPPNPEASTSGAT
jgi:hypothetical protein